MKWIVLLIFGTIGAAALIGGLSWTAKRYHLIRTGLVAHGKVVEQHEQMTTETDDDNPRLTRTYSTYYPVVEFKTAREETIRFQGSTGGIEKPVIETGTTVSVVYDASDPYKAVIGDFTQVWLGPVVLLIAGFIFLVFGVGGFAVIGQSDRSFEAMHRMMTRDALMMRKDSIRIQATICRVERLEGDDSEKYVLVCKGLRPGEKFEEEFQTDSFTFEPDSSFMGRRVDVYLDPQDIQNYCVSLGPLLKEILSRSPVEKDIGGKG